MLKSELIERIAAQNPHLYLQDAEKVVNAILEPAADASSPVSRGRKPVPGGRGACPRGTV